MIKVSEVKSTPPQDFSTPLHKAVYTALKELDIPFERVDNTPALTMEDCVEIDRALNVKTVKTLLLCNRQKTDFYLFVTAGDKPFVTKNFSHTLGISRVSFAPEEALQRLLGTELGATTVFSMLLESSSDVSLVIDSEVLRNEYYGCTDGTTTGYMRIRTADLINVFLPYTGRTAKIIDI